YMVELFEENDLNEIILILTELKLFIHELITYFDDNQDKGLFEIRYIRHVIKEVRDAYGFEDGIATNVIHKIFINKMTLRMLYRLGLTDKKSQESLAEQEI